MGSNRVEYNRDLTDGLEREALELEQKTLVKTPEMSDYSHRDAPIRVAFFDNRIEVENPGILLPGMAVPIVVDKPITQAKVQAKVQVEAQVDLNILSRLKIKSRLESRLESQLESGLESGLESETAKNALRVLAKQPLQRSEIADALGHDKVSGAVNRAIKELLAKQLIEYTIPDKPNSRLQKYRLTPLGKSLLATEGNRHES